LQKYESGVRVTDLANMYSMSKSTLFLLLKRLGKGCFGRFGTHYGYFLYFLREKLSWLTTNLSYDQPSRTNWVRKSRVRCITYSECMLVALVIQMSKRMCRAILSFVACPALPNFSTLSHKRRDSWKIVIENKIRVFVSPATFVWNISHS
jgi:hypothetical protein